MCDIRARAHPHGKCCTQRCDTRHIDTSAAAATVARMNTTQRLTLVIAAAFIAAVLAAVTCAIGYHAGYSAPHPMTYSQHVDGRDYLCTLSVTADGNVYDNCQLGG